MSIVVAGANVHDAKLLEATLDAIVVERPQPTEEEPQHLCLDKGYDNPSGRGAAAGHGYREHIRRIGEEKLDASGDKRYPARRWVVERTLAWLSKCRAVLVRYDKKAANYLGVSSGPHHQDSGEAKIRESTAGVSRKPSSDGKARGCSSKQLSGLTAWNT